MVWKKIRGGVGHAHGSSPRGWGRGESEPTRSQPLVPPAYRRRTIPIHRGGAGTHGGRLLYGEADSIPHEEEGGGWDMLDRGCGMQEEEGICWTGDAECGRWRRLECDLCL